MYCLCIPDLSIDFYDFITPLFSSFKFRLRRYIKHSRLCFTTFPTPAEVRQKYTAARPSTFFSVFGNVVEHVLSCDILLDHPTDHTCSLAGRSFCGVVLSAGHSSCFSSKHFTPGPVCIISRGKRLLD